MGESKLMCVCCEDSAVLAGKFKSTLLRSNIYKHIHNSTARTAHIRAVLTGGCNEGVQGMPQPSFLSGTAAFVGGL